MAKTPNSKALTVKNRPVLADPRVVSGFRPLVKNIVYPIVVKESSGCHLKDVDDNKYVDITSGFGSNFFGFGAPFIADAVREQALTGMEIGPQNTLAGEVAHMIRELTGMERVAFCNTGSEAVLGAMRLARTVTGRSTIVTFDGDYHGIFDEVIYRATPSGRTIPAAPGIPPDAVINLLVLELGSEESLKTLREQADDIAAILIEPIQGRRPGYCPVEFIRECRKIATETGAAFIMDEVITGFRMHQGGMQALLDVEADLVTYGKVVGGGMPIGVLAGKHEFMDALDGGQWSYGDDSFPEVGVTYFAGTFVRHPLTMAAARAALTYMKAQGPELQNNLNRKADALVERLNQFCREQYAPLKFVNSGSMFQASFNEGEPLTDIFYAWMRLKGIHIWEGRVCFLTIAHTDEDIQQIETAFQETIREMGAVGLLTIDKPPFEVVDGQLMVPTTEPQKEIWLAVMLMAAEASKAYNESVSLYLNGPLDKRALRKAVQQVVFLHDGQRCTFTDDGLWMRVNPKTDFELEEKVLDEAGFQQLLLDEVDILFNTETGPLLHGVLVERSTEDHVLVLTSHHIVCDGWSIDVVIQDIGKIYSALSAGQTPQLDAPRSIVEYAQAELEWLTSDEFKAAQEFWLGLYQGNVPVLDLPTDRPRPQIRTSNSHRKDSSIDRAGLAQMKSACREMGCTLVNLLLAVYILYLRKQSGQRDIVVGLPTSGQSARNMEQLVGHCVNMLPIRCRVDDHETFSELVKRLRVVMLDAFEHELYTFGTLVKNLRMSRDMSRIPLTPVIFNVDNGIDMEQIKYGELETRLTSNPRNHESFELFLNAVEEHGELLTEWSYNTNLFDHATIEHYIEEYEFILQRVASFPDIPISQL